MRQRSQLGGHCSNSGSRCSGPGQHGLKRAGDIRNSIRTHKVQNLRLMKYVMGDGDRKETRDAHKLIGTV